MSDILNAFIKNSRVVYLKSGNIGFVGIVFLLYFKIFPAYQQFTDQQNRQNHPDHSERIGHGTSQSWCTAFKPHLLQRLLGCSQSRSVSGGTTQNAYHIG